MDETDDSPPTKRSKKQNPEIDTGLIIWILIVVAGLILVFTFITMLSDETYIEINTPVQTQVTAIISTPIPTRTYVTISPTITTTINNASVGG